jgi:hypothetical protein
VITPADKPNAALFSFAIAQMRFRIEATPMHTKLEPGARFSRRDLSLGECLRHSVCRTLTRRISVEYTTIKYWIMDIQPIEIIRRRRTVVDGGGSIIWPTQGGRVPRPRFAAGGLDRPSAARRLARSAGKVMEAIGLHRSRTRSVGVCWRADRDEPKVSLNVRPNHSGRRERSRALGLLTGLGKPPRSECHGRARLTQPTNLPLLRRYRP